MTWTAHHHREDVLRAVIDEANRRRDGQLPTELPGVTDTFAEDLTLVAALQMRWHTRLSGSIERMLLEQPSDLETSVLTAWRETADELPGVRLVLDQFTAHPTSPEMEHALDIAHRKEWALLAAMAGLASAQDAAAARVGARLEKKAREAYDPRSAAPQLELVDEPGHKRHVSLLDRIKSHLAA